jgi:S-adenosylmethionine decarboxylase
VRALGRQLLLECYGCSAARLNDVPFIRDTILAAATQSNATIVQESFHRFNPYGVSGVVVIAESHITIHTWPEFKYAAVDIFTCGDLLDAMVIREVIEARLDAESICCTELRRGLLPAAQYLTERPRSGGHTAKRDNGAKSASGLGVNNILDGAPWHPPGGFEWRPPEEGTWQ